MNRKRLYVRVISIILCAALCICMACCSKEEGNNTVNTEDKAAGNVQPGGDMTNTPEGSGQGADTEKAEPVVTDEAKVTEHAVTELPTAAPEKVDIYAGIKKGVVGAGVSVHDPSILAVDGKYYIYGTHMTEAVSENMRKWKYIGNGYSAGNPMFENLFAEGLGVFDFAGDYGDGSYAVWAPHVIYNKAMQKYVMYVCTSSTYIKSDICWAISDVPEGPYVWQGNLLYSGFTKETIGLTDIYDYVSEEYAAETYLKSNGEYNNQLWPNCIDPTVFYDTEGRMWMTYGSWSGGIFLIEIDEKTGLIIHPETDEENSVDAYFGKRLLGRDHKSIEGPYIQYDNESGYYYLFLSYGGLDRVGGYQIRVLRSKTVDGEYVDMNGKYPTAGYNHAYYGVKLSGNYILPSLYRAYMATGGQSAFEDSDGKKYVCYHTRVDNGTEAHEPRVKQYFINAEGWPVLAPYATDGETISETGYSMTDVTGEYFFINQGTAIDAEIAEPVLIKLGEDGTVTGDGIEGTWSMTEGTSYMHLTYQDVEYSGVFLRQKDEAGTEVMTFTAVGANESIWGVKY